MNTINFSSYKPITRCSSCFLELVSSCPLNSAFSTIVCVRSNYMSVLEASKTGSNRYYLPNLTDNLSDFNFASFQQLFVQVAGKLTIAICLSPYVFREFFNASMLQSLKLPHQFIPNVLLRRYLVEDPASHRYLVSQLPHCKLLTYGFTNQVLIVDRSFVAYLRSASAEAPGAVLPIGFF